MSPQIYPGVQIAVVDNSNISILNSTIITAMIGQFEKGPDDVPMLVNSTTFEQYFGNDIENCPDKTKYISAIQMLNSVQGIQCLNVTNGALYGGIHVGPSTVTPFAIGVSEIGAEYNTYNFKPTITNEVDKTGDGSTKTFDYFLQNVGIGIIPNSVTISFTIGITTYNVTDTVAGVFTNANLTSGTINYATGEIHLVFITAPANATHISTTYQYTSSDLFVLVAVSKGVWSDNDGIQITAIGSDFNDFTIQVTEIDSNNVANVVETFVVSLISGQQDGFGAPIYIESVFKNQSTRFYAIVNPYQTVGILPLVGNVITYAAGGNSGIAPTSTNFANAIQTFYPENIGFDLFCGSGITDPTIISAISQLVNAKYKIAYVDTIAGTAPAVVNYMQTQLTLDDLRTSIYTPFQYVPYNGLEYYCPLSALAAQQKAVRVLNGEPFMPPAGIGSDRGSINTRQEFYYSAADALTMHDVNVNVARYFTSYGNVIFTDFTLQKKLTATSYQNAVETLNNMITQAQNLLLVINFRVINDSTFLQMETLLKSYLAQLSSFDGTIEPDEYTIDFSQNTAVTKDAGQILCKIVFVFQNLTRQIILELNYTSNQLYTQVTGT